MPTVGVYGIGMKRAIFKIGKHCLISTQSQRDCYEVEIKPKWITDPDDWDLLSNSNRLNLIKKMEQQLISVN